MNSSQDETATAAGVQQPPYQQQSPHQQPPPHQTGWHYAGSAYPGHHGGQSYAEKGRQHPSTKIFSYGIRALALVLIFCGLVAMAHCGLLLLTGAPDAFGPDPEIVAICLISLAGIYLLFYAVFPIFTAIFCGARKIGALIFFAVAHALFPVITVAGFHSVKCFSWADVASLLVSGLFVGKIVKLRSG